jgi:hypothetical protein
VKQPARIQWGIISLLFSRFTSLLPLLYPFCTSPPSFLTVCVAMFVVTDLKTAFHTEFVAMSAINVNTLNYFEISFKYATN